MQTHSTLKNVFLLGLRLSVRSLVFGLFLSLIFLIGCEAPAGLKDLALTPPPASGEATSLSCEDCLNPEQLRAPKHFETPAVLTFSPGSKPEWTPIHAAKIILDDPYGLAKRVDFPVPFGTHYWNHGEMFMPEFPDHLTVRRTANYLLSAQLSARCLSRKTCGTVYAKIVKNSKEVLAYQILELSKGNRQVQVSVEWPLQENDLLELRVENRGIRQVQINAGSTWFSVRSLPGL